MLDELIIDCGDRAVTVVGNPVHLNTMDYNLLIELVTVAGRVLTKTTNTNPENCTLFPPL